MATYAAFFEESRMKFTDAATPDRKSGGTPGKHRTLADFQDLSNCDLGVCRYFFQGIFLLGKRP